MGEYLFFNFENAINRADFDALRLIEMPFALNADVRVDFKEFITFDDGFDRAFGFASSAVDTLIRIFYGMIGIGIDE